MKLGIATNSIFRFQLTNNIFNSLNRLSSEDIDLDCYLFREVFSPFPMQPNFSIMSLVDMWGFDGTVIATDIPSVDKLLGCPCPKRKLFYVWNLEWVFQGNPLIKNLERFYLNNEIQLIARSKSHFDVISSVWKSPIGILEDFNYEQLRQFI